MRCATHTVTQQKEHEHKVQETILLGSPMELYLAGLILHQILWPPDSVGSGRRDSVGSVHLVTNCNVPLISYQRSRQPLYVRPAPSHILVNVSYHIIHGECDNPGGDSKCYAEMPIWKNSRMRGYTQEVCK